MNKVFNISGGFKGLDGTIIYPFLNPKDGESPLPWDLFDGFSIAAGDIEPNTASRVHVMPHVTQVTLVLSAQLEVIMKDDDKPALYTHYISPGQAVLTRPGTFLQLINRTSSYCRALYIVSPAYLFDMSASGEVRYDDSVIIEENWDQLAQCNWQPRKLAESGVTNEARKAASERVARRKMTQQ